MVNRSTDMQTKLERRGISRREFLAFCGAMAATLALPASYRHRIARAVAQAPRPPLVWLEFQDCTGDTESFLRARQPDVDDLLLETISLNYHETIMVPAGAGSERSLEDTIAQEAGRYVCIVEGSIPIRDGGIYCTIRGRTALSILQEVTGSAMATLAIGTCAWDGGLAAAAPNPTGAVGVRGAVPGLSPFLALPGCPANAVNITAALVHLLTFGAWPSADGEGRPRFAYGDEIHERCERHRHYEADRYALAWGDEGHRQGWCLKRLGCKGPETHHNCPTAKWNDGTCWPIGAGHPCIGCAEPAFWDRHAPFYSSEGDDDDDD